MTWIYVGIGVVVAFVIASIVIVQMSEPMPPGTTDADIARVAREGDSIRAIRWYRTVHGTGLKKAKEAVDRLAAENERTDHGR